MGFFSSSSDVRIKSRCIIVRERRNIFNGGLFAKMGYIIRKRNNKKY